MNGYAIVIERAADGGFGAWSPDVPGCVAVAATPDEALRDMRSAVRDHLDLLRGRGEPVPVPATVLVDLLAA